MIREKCLHTTNGVVKNPATNDVLKINFSSNIESYDFLFI